MTFSAVQERVERRRRLDEKFEEMQRLIGTDNDLIQINIGDKKTYTGRLIDYDEEYLIFDDRGRYYFPKNFIDPRDWRTVKKIDLIGIDAF